MVDVRPNPVWHLRRLFLPIWKPHWPGNLETAFGVLPCDSRLHQHFTFGRQLGVAINASERLVSENENAIIYLF